MQKRKATTAKRPKSRAKPVPVKKGDTKQQRLIEMLKRPRGATIGQLAKSLDWQEHTVRGTMSGALKKRLGLIITSNKEEGGRVYRISSSVSRVAS